MCNAHAIEYLFAATVLFACLSLDIEGFCACLYTVCMPIIITCTICVSKLNKTMWSLAHSNRIGIDVESVQRLKGPYNGHKSKKKKRSKISVQSKLMLRISIRHWYDCEHFTVKYADRRRYFGNRQTWREAEKIKPNNMKRNTIKIKRDLQRVNECAI